MMEKTTEDGYKDAGLHCDYARVRGTLQERSGPWLTLWL